MRSSRICRDGAARGPVVTAAAAGWPSRLAARAAAVVAVVAVLLTMSAVRGVEALDPERGMSQYIRDRWGAEHGFPSGPVSAIAQTADGYLWIGTEKGLVRFDGVEFRLITHGPSSSSGPSPSSGAAGSTGQALPLGPVLGLATDADGGLWVRLQGQGLLRYRDGRLESVMGPPLEHEAATTAMIRSRGGDMLVSMLVNGTQRYRGGRFEPVVRVNALPPSPVIALAEGADGTIWLGTRDTGLFTLKGARVAPAPADAVLPDRKVNTLLALDSGGGPGGGRDDGGDVWIGTDSGAVRWRASTREVSHVSPLLDRVQALAMLRDRDGTVWIGTSRGLVRVAADDGRSGGARVGGTRGAPGSSGAGGGGAARARSGEGAGAGDLVVSSLDPFDSLDALESSDPRDPAALARRRGSASYGGRDSLQSLAWRESRASGIPRVPPARPVTALFEDREGSLWIGGPGGLERLRDSAFVTYGVGEGLPSDTVGPIFAAANGRLWFAPLDGGLAWLEGAGARPATAARVRQVSAAVLSADVVYSIAGGTVTERTQEIWIGRQRGGLTRLRVGAASTDGTDRAGGGESVGSAGSPGHAERAGGGTLAAETYTQRDGLAQDSVYAVMRSRDGAVWAGTLSGGVSRLEEGRDGQRGRFTTYTTADGLGSNTITALLEGADGTIWAGTSNGLSSLSRRPPDGQPSAVRAAPGRERWQTHGPREGLPAEAIHALFEDASGVLWIGTAAGLAYRRDGIIRTISTTRVAGSSTAGAGDGTGAAGSATGATTASTSTASTSTSGASPVPTSSTSIGDAAGDAGGALREPVFGLAQDRTGALWIATANRLLQVRPETLLRGVQDDDLREYGLADGLHELEGVRRHRSLTADARGRVWVALNRGLSMLDPTRAASRDAPALVQIQEVSVDGVVVDLGRASRRSEDAPANPAVGATVDAGTAFARTGAAQAAAPRIGPGAQRVTFAYAGLSLAVPERVRYRYRLDGFDRDWSAPVAAREAVYTNLAPGPYHFRVMASNSDGRWSAAEAGVRFEIAPAFWQTWWFRGTLLLAAGLAGLLIYRVRMHQVAHQLNVRFEERLDERTRIAQELHDTLLQGFLSASMQLHVAAAQVPADSPAKPRIGRVLELMQQVIEEGRHAVRGLRSTQGAEHDLEQAFSRIPQELVAPAAAAQAPVGFRVLVEGRSRPLHPLIRDEVYRIGREALLNAYRHAGAQSIEVALEYAPHHLRVRVRDDGRGIDDEVLRAGRDGHWGLSGMRERAERIGARLTVWSRPGAGTEIDLTIPGHRAFQKGSGEGP